MSIVIDARASTRGSTSANLPSWADQDASLHLENGTSPAPFSRRAFLGRLAGLSASALALGAAAGAAGPVLASAVLPAPAAAQHPLVALMSRHRDLCNTINRLCDAQEMADEDEAHRIEVEEMEPVEDALTCTAEAMVEVRDDLDVSGAIAAVEALSYVGMLDHDGDPDACLYYRLRHAMTQQLAAFLRGLAAEGGLVHG